MHYFDAQARDLAELAARGRGRRLIGREGADFASNDYLGLADSPALREAVVAALARGVPIGSGGSRLLRGNQTEHEALEADAAAFFGRESALYFSSGYAANAALLGTLPQRGDLVLFDELVHASAHEGMRLGRAETRQAAHNDVAAFAAAIADWRRAGGAGRVWIAVESLYSMDGDLAPLAELSALAAAEDAILLVDEAHATGVYGPQGQGLAYGLPTGNLITLHTCGKALGCEGALVTGPAVVRDFLVNRGRAFIFSTAPSPLMAAAVRAALRIVGEGDALRRALFDRVRTARAALGPLGVLDGPSQVLPLILGDDVRTMTVAGLLQESGFDVRGIRPPTVPAGTSRLRISITNNVTLADIAALADRLATLISATETAAA
ncbi:8-amino-7-oxononanoate synthase [Sphingomonas pokkalii]|uniref:8-amino-7-oxononanoate synthase n=1 Tax=Sphingomonas pokkalii TaxID=2175090 RepID=A0A2U0SI92_9SPHN|nr:8-amino-7-oxononanoate synthase [Sphingomonas pokkalii]PVX31063.1 8-amino-7-oxononanoate synthase [Sphingomonas pokkalii]